MGLSSDLFVRESLAANHMERISRPSLSFWKDAGLRLVRNKLAIAGLTILLIMTLLSIAAPFFSPYRFSDQFLDQVGKPPSAAHWFGTDDLGRDLWTRVWMGGRISLFIGVTAAVIEMGIGVLYGGIAGYVGGQLDEIMMRVIEIIYAIPGLLLQILMMVVLGPGIGTMILVFVLTGWVGMARLVRGQILQLKEQEFVLAAKTLGASPGRLILKHLIPNVMGPILVSVTMGVPGAIFTEAALSFIGLGVPMPLASWGSLANDGYQWMRLFPWTLLFPATAIALTMLAFNLFGDGLRDALDPKLRGRG